MNVAIRGGSKRTGSRAGAQPMNMTTGRQAGKRGEPSTQPRTRLTGISLLAPLELAVSRCAREATPRQESFESAIGSEAVPIGIDRQENQMDIARIVGALEPVEHGIRPSEPGVDEGHRERGK